MNTKYNTRVTFKVYPSAILGDKFNDCMFVGSIPYSHASGFKGFDAAALHAAIYPTIPEGNNVANDPASYNYLIVKFADGHEELVGETWIDAGTVHYTTNTITVLEFEHTNADIDKILVRAVISNGYTPSKMYHKE